MGRDLSLARRQGFGAPKEPAPISVRVQRAQDVRHQPPRRRFLIVSAPFGPFSRDLARALRASGADVLRVVLNAGDRLDWGTEDAPTFRGRRETWTRWLADTLTQAQVTDLITYGDTSFYTAAALEAARAGALRTHILEQGYYRPDWVTLETQGVNAHTHMPRDAEWYRRHPAATIEAPSQSVGLSTPNAVRYIVAYHVAAILGAPAYPHFRSGYQDSAIRQALGHSARFVAQRLNFGSDRRAYQGAVRAAGPKFLVLLQRPGDSQLRKHSRFADVPDFMEQVTADFAKHATADANLIFRPHPLDPGLTNYRRMIKRLARRFGVQGRLHYCDYGKLHEVLALMQGVVCINSSAGLAGVEFTVPTITLGDSLYDIPGLTHQGGLAAFWRKPEAPDPELYKAFRNVHMATTQINGGFATHRGRTLAVPMVAKRLLGARDDAALSARPPKASSAA